MKSVNLVQRIILLVGVATALLVVSVAPTKGKYYMTREIDRTVDAAALAVHEGIVVFCTVASFIAVSDRRKKR
jgi:hypothetical protein